ncbi:hypothetical protein Vadar_033402 [Vaccinium darrowii]|uniref:Uncharacterized protein n=1 Tax=Vaccinium darrowii TaxID=229202 RepID=A0ACB7XLQ6_9ERIC|nr:hypothetical protein Vadar_033402 [Vaccinium darrowii]
MEGEDDVVYGACNRNYAAEIGMYVLDGCGEFALDSAGSRYCEACGCDKNFHIVIVPNRTTTATTSINNLGAKPNTNMNINGGRIRLSVNENSVLTLVSDGDDQVEVNGPEIVDERSSTATSGTKSKKNKKKNKK